MSWSRLMYCYKEDIQKAVDSYKEFKNKTDIPTQPKEKDDKGFDPHEDDDKNEDDFY